MAKRVTIRDIAAKLGYHYATISLALRRHPSIPQKTANTICNTAKEMGYTTNPMLAAWMADVRFSRHTNFKSTLAYLNLLEYPITTNSHLFRYFSGASDQAKQYGYNLLLISICEPSMTYRRINHILKHSGIRGVIIGPKTNPGHISLDWDRLAAICIGHSLIRPNLNRVVHQQKHGMQMALRQITKKGYKRIGFIINKNFDRRTDYNYSSAFLNYYYNIPEKERIPILFEESNLDSILKPWTKKWKPECIISHSWHQVLSLLAHEIPVVTSDWFGDNKTIAGIDQDYYQIGATAVDILVTNLVVNRYGLPSNPFTVSIEGSWANGSALPTIKK